MIRIATEDNYFNNYGLIILRIILIFLLIHALLGNKSWGVTSIRGDVAFRLDESTPIDTYAPPYLITAGSNGIFTLEVSNGTPTARNRVLDSYFFSLKNDGTDRNTLGNYTIIIKGGCYSFNTGVNISPLIDMRNATNPGTINIISSGSTFKSELKLHYQPDYGSYGNARVTVLYNAPVIDFTGASAKLNFIQDDINNNANKIIGRILGSNNGDSITINGGIIDGSIILGNGANSIKIKGNSILYSSEAEVAALAVLINGGNGSNTIDLINTDISILPAGITGKLSNINGIIDMEATGTNTLNIGSSLENSKYDTGGDINNMQNINVKSPITGNGSIFNVKNLITGVLNLNIDLNSRIVVTTNGSIVGKPITELTSTSTTGSGSSSSVATSSIAGSGSSSSAATSSLAGSSSSSSDTKIINNGTLIINNSGSITNLDLENNSNFSINNGIFNYPSILKNNKSGTITLGSDTTGGQVLIADSVIMLSRPSSSIASTTDVTSSDASGTLINNGELIIKPNGKISASNIKLNGYMSSGGTIDCPINFGNTGGILNLTGGTIKSITGGTGLDIINIISTTTIPLSTSGNISAIEKINVNSGIFNITDLITGLSTRLKVGSNSVVNLLDGGDLAGGGDIKNLGAINIQEGSISDMRNFDNRGSFNLISDTVIKLADFTNNAIGSSLSIKSGNMYVNSLINTLGGVYITNADLSTVAIAEPDPAVNGTANTTPVNYGILFNAPNQIITLSGTGSIGAVNGFDTINNKGNISLTDSAIINCGTINNGISNSIAGSSIQRNPSRFTIGGGKVLIGSTSSLGKINNNFGSIVISGQGDLSSASLTALSPIMNGAGQTINILDTGTIGNNFPLGELINKGTINASGGDLILGSITNGDSITNNSGIISITKGTIFSGNINNNLGVIQIYSSSDPLGNIVLGDISSVNPDNPSTLVNNFNQTITVATGTIGSFNQFGTVTNKGVINVNNNINVGNISNEAQAILNFTGGSLNQVGNITNDGQIIISNSTSKPLHIISNNLVNASNLNNNVGGIITVYDKTNLGVNGALGTVNNKGIINGLGGNIVVHDFNNNHTNAKLNVIGSNVKLGNISNILGSIIIKEGDLSSIDEINHSSLFNDASQTIEIQNNGTIGSLVNHQLGEVTNYGVFKANGGNVTADLFTNSKTGAASTGGYLEIDHGALKFGEINNIFGKISIKGGDLSGISGNFTTFNNESGQTVTIENTGTIGLNQRLGAVNNKGIINANGGNINIGDFSNISDDNVSGGQLNITNGIVKTGNINNNLGSINISNGDLSGFVDNSSNLINAENQTIIVNGFGTIGANNKLGFITNEGFIDATTSQFKALTLNNSSSGKFNLTNKNQRGVVMGGILIDTINNRGIISLDNANLTADGINDLQVNKFNNLNNSICNINGCIKFNGNLINNETAEINLKANFDLGDNNKYFINDGVVELLAPVDIIHGNYILGSTGVHKVNINNGVVNVLNLKDGRIQLENESIISLALTGNFLVRSGERFIIMTGNGSAGTQGITGNLSGINFKDNSSLMYYGLSINGNNLIVTANRRSIASIINSTNKTNLSRNINTTATELDNLMNNSQNIKDPNLIAALAYLEQLPSDEAITEAVNQLSPDPNIRDVTLATSGTFVPEVIAQRTELMARAKVNNLYTGYSAGDLQSDDGFWFKGIGGSIEQKTQDSFVGYNANSVGMILGLDTKLIENTWVGLGLSSVGTHIKSKNYPAKRTTVSSYQVTAYGSYSVPKYYVDLHGAIAINNYKTIRNIEYVNQVAVANFSAVQPAAKVALGYIYKKNNFNIIPNISLQAATLYQNPYNETGAGGIRLHKVSSIASSKLEVGAGVKFTLADDQDSEKIYTPELHVMLLHDFKAVQQEVTAQFMGGGSSFKVQGAIPDKNTYNIGGGLVLIHKNRLNFKINYEWRKKNKFIGHSGALAVRYVF